MKYSFEKHFQVLPQPSITQNSQKTNPNQKILFLKQGHNQKKKKKTSNKDETKG